MRSRKSLADPARVKVFSSLISASLYGGWVAYCARQQPMLQMVESALAQWLLSFAATFAFSALISRLVGSSQRYNAAALAAGLAIALYAGVLFGIHAMVGTPHPLSTLLPVLILAGAYACFFASLQVRHNLRPALP
ncbi:hypothetical protein [Pseudomonas citri]|uniref:hypothetical protein n=1 Tax=Pseudomonas citri TaxID=2978349 RepID=UPI0021B510EC|nr:hypothetical protein [Pseudomonas citri]